MAHTLCPRDIAENLFVSGLNYDQSVFNATVRQLEYFVAVAEHGTIAAAAAECRIGAVALGQGLKELDRAFGTPLTTRRRSKGVELTPAGRAVLPRAQRILRDVAQLPMLIDDHDLPPRTFRVGAINNLSPWTIPPLVDYFEADNRGISLDFVEGEMEELRPLMDRGEIDLILTYRDRLLADLAVHPIRRLIPYVMLGSGHRLAGRDVLRFRDLAEENFVLIAAGPSVEVVSTALHDHGLEKQIRWHSRNIETVKGIVGGGRAVAVLFSFGHHDTTLDGQKLTAVPLADPMIDNRVVACTPAGVPVSGLTRDIIDWLRALPAPPGIAAAESRVWSTATSED